MSDILRGTIERITYHNEENGYTVAQLMPEGQAYTVTVVGNMLGINVGESVAVDGAWTAMRNTGASSGRIMCVPCCPPPSPAWKSTWAAA